MPARLILETDLIDVSRPPVLVYGQPGSGKTSLAQTAKNPLTLDFDGGAHRSAFRKTVIRVDSWEELVTVQRDGMEGMGPNFAGFETIVLDTVDTLLKSMSATIIAGNQKMGTKAGGLSIQGWGVLKTTFDNWLAALRQTKQMILIAHQKEEKDGDNRMMRPDIAGGSYGIVMNQADIVGYISYRNNARFVSWEPTDAYFAKNGAQLKSGPIPDFSSNPHFMADLLTQAKANLGHTAEASAAVAQAVADWTAKLDAEPPLEKLNAMLPDLKMLTKPAKAQVWNLILARTAATDLEFDDASKTFKVKEAA